MRVCTLVRLHWDDVCMRSSVVQRPRRDARQVVGGSKSRNWIVGAPSLASVGRGRAQDAAVRRWAWRESHRVARVMRSAPAEQVRKTTVSVSVRIASLMPESLCDIVAPCTTEVSPCDASLSCSSALADQQRIRRPRARRRPSTVEMHGYLAVFRGMSFWTAESRPSLHRGARATAVARASSTHTGPLQAGFIEVPLAFLPACVLSGAARVICRRMEAMHASNRTARSAPPSCPTARRPARRGRRSGRVAAGCRGGSQTSS